MIGFLNSALEDFSRLHLFSPSMLSEIDDDKEIAAFNGVTTDQLEGGDVINATGTTIGEVDEILAASGNQAVAAIVESGGFLGIGSSAVIVPLSDLQYDAQKEAFVANMTVDQLKAMHKVERDFKGHLK